MVFKKLIPSKNQGTEQPAPTGAPLSTSSSFLNRLNGISRRESSSNKHSAEPESPQKTTPSTTPEPEMLHEVEPNTNTHPEALKNPFSLSPEQPRDSHDYSSSNPFEKNGHAEADWTSSKATADDEVQDFDGRAQCHADHHSMSTATLVATTAVHEPAQRNNSPEKKTGFDVHNVSLPYGDGATKVFGMENFGASCYCNSIVQSLYFSRSFRRYMLYLPTGLSVEPVKPHARKTSVPGLRPHHFTTAAAQKSEDQEVRKEESEHTSKLGRRMSFFKKNGSKGNNASSESEENEEPGEDKRTYRLNSDGNLQNGETVIYRAKSNLLGLQDLKLGYQVPNRNVTVVGVVDDPAATAEQRKRKALTDGPILNLDHLLTPNGSDTMFDALKDIFESMVECLSKTGVVSPVHLLSVVKRENELFRSLMHQDAHEFFNCVMNGVFEQLEDYYRRKKETEGTDIEWMKSEQDFSSSLFEGQLVSQTKCLRCERISSRDEKFIDLSIDLENNSSVTACLKQFSSNELLCEDNKFYCEYCLSLQEATKRMLVKKLPRILTLHLKRFKYSEELNRLTKLFHRVSYPLYLRLFNTTEDDDEDKVYELYLVVVHIGGGPYHGHYVLCIKTEQSGWLLFDDETVESIDENFVLRFFGDGPGLASAYILFYQEITEEEYISKTLHKDLDLKLDMEDELFEELHHTELRTPNFGAKAQSRESVVVPPLDIPKVRKNSAASPTSPITGSVEDKLKRTRSKSVRSPLTGSFKGEEEELGRRKSIFGFNKIGRKKSQ